MHLIPYIHFFCLITYAYFGLHILIYNRKAVENRILSILVFLFALWSLSMMAFHNPETSKELAEIVYNISSVAWIFMSGFFVWFHLTFTENTKFANKPLIFSLYTFVPLALVIAFLLGNYFSYELKNYGWIKEFKPSIWLFLFLIYTFISVIISWVYLMKFIRNTKDRVKAKQARILLVQNIIILILGILFEYALPQLTNSKFPQMGNITLVFWFPGILFAISKYKLFAYSPTNNQARKILDTVNESLIIIDNYGKVQSLNNAAIRFTGYKSIELFRKDISVLFADRELLEAIENKQLISKKDSVLENRDGRSLPVSVTLTILTDEEGIPSGHIIMFAEQEDRLESEKLEREHLKTLKQLSDAAIGFVELPADEDIFQYIGERLKEAIGESLIIISAVDETLGVTTTRAIYGLGKFTSQVMKLMGAHPLGNSYKIIPSEEMPDLYSGKLEEFHGGLYDLSFRQIPKNICTSVEKLLKLDKYYGIAFVWNGVMYGNAAIITFKDKPLKNQHFIETFSYQASIAVQKRIAEQALRFSEKKYKNYIDNSPDGIFVINRSGHFVEVNQSSCRLTNFTQSELLEMDVYQIVTPESAEHSAEMFKYLLENGKSSAVLMFRRKGEKPFYMQVDTTQITRDRFIAFAKDVSSNIIANEKLKAALEEKDVLLKEVHHRVKNNMQVIISLINMQLNDEQLEPPVVEKFRVLQERVRAMSFIHEGLYTSKDLSKIDFGNYLERLTQNLMDLYSTGKNIKLDFNVDNILFDINKAIPCGMAVNELISNALKYAFKENGTEEDVKENIISLELKQQGDFYSLIVADNGKGMPKDIDFENTDSLGLWLVNILVKDQLDGNLVFENKQGVKFNISFPIN